MKKMYFSVDIEASGRSPGKYSMLSIGACVVGDIKTTFYKELKPISNNFMTKAMRIGCLGLKCLEKYKNIERYNPKNENFRPGLILQVLRERGEEQEVVMKEFAEWILKTSKGYQPVIAAAPIIFDGGFITYYFDNYYEGENPFIHSGEDINSMYRGYVKNVNASIKDLNLRNENGLNHNSLEDAIQQAKEFEMVLSLMKN